MEKLIKLVCKKYFNNNGIGLIEAIIALAFGVIIIVSLLTLSNFNTRNSLLVRSNQDAINDGNLLLENLRTMKDQNFINFLNSVTPCTSNNKCTLNQGNINVINISDLNLNTPTSYFSINKISNNEIELNIMTLWKIGNTVFSSPISTVFTNWRSK